MDLTSILQLFYNIASGIACHPRVDGDPVVIMTMNLFFHICN